MNTDLKIVIMDKVKLERRVHELKRRDEGIKARLAPILKQLWNPERDLAVGAEGCVFDDLITRFPNFSEVIEYWRVQALLSTRLNTSFQSAPVLLGGPPGLGKTFFAYEAAKALGLFYEELNMSSVTANFVISGGSLQWSEGAVGMVAKTLASSPIGNPIIVLDEIDKSSSGNKYSILGPFYPLLERHSARRFKDEALELEMDCSHINWVLTANDIFNIPTPILSRTKVFQIELPKSEQLPLVVKNIYENIRKSEAFGHLLDENLPDQTIEIFDGISPRLIKRKLTEACTKVFIEKRSLVMPFDVQNDFKKPSRFKMGFI